MNIQLNDIISILSSVTAAIFSCGTYFKGLKHDKKQDTLDAYNQLQEQAFDKLNEKSKEEILEISKKLRSAEYREISSYIARIEHFCVGVNSNIYDKETVYQLAHGFLDGAIKEKIAPILERKRYNGENFYQHTTKMLEWMKNREEKERKKRK